MQEEHQIGTKLEGRDDERKKHTEISNPGMSLLNFVSDTKNWCNFDERGRHDLIVNDRLSQVSGNLHPNDPPGLRRLGGRPRASSGGGHSDDTVQKTE